MADKMAAEETAFSPKESYSVTGAIGSGAVLKRNSVPTSYYASFDCSASSIHSSSCTLPTLTSAASLESPSDFQGHAADDSSDHEREDSDGESLCETGGGVRSYRRCYSGRSSGASVHLLGEGVEIEKEGALREDVVRPPYYALTCTLIPPWAVKHCEFYIFMLSGSGLLGSCLLCLEAPPQFK